MDRRMVGKPVVMKRTDHRLWWLSKLGRQGVGASSLISMIQPRDFPEGERSSTQAQGDAHGDSGLGNGRKTVLTQEHGAHLQLQMNTQEHTLITTNIQQMAWGKACPQHY